jgi:ribulose-5-phosphate 4-epimerase/fuculose-1-phosphate aldolase
LYFRDENYICTSKSTYLSFSRDEIYIAPSGVQKERIQPEDMFVQTMAEKDLDGPPPAKKLKKSQCTPLFMNAYTMRSKFAFGGRVAYLVWKAINRLYHAQ